MRLLIIFCISVVFSLGLVMVFNTTSAEILDRSLEQDTHYALVKQIIFAMVGCFFFCIVYKIGYHFFLKVSFLFLFLGVFLLLLVFIPGIGQMRNGAHRWIGVSHLTLQPSELVKIVIPLCFIQFVSNQKEINFKNFLKIAVIALIPIFLVMIEPDNGTAAVMGSSLIPLFFLSKIPMKFWVLPCVVFIIIGIFAAFSLPYVKARIEVYLNPEIDIKGKGHQPHQAKIAAGSGKFLGRGPGNSLQKLNYLPEAQNDYIAAIYAEEFGFLGVVLLICLYMIFCFAGHCIAMRCPEKEGCLLAMSVTFLISFQAFLNLGVVSGLLPSKGVNLPFFSQGGTSLIANFIALGLLLSIEKARDLTGWLSIYKDAKQ